MDAAVGLLVAGVDTPNLRILAGEDYAEPDEAEAWLDKALRDLGLAPLSRHDAVLSLATKLAHDGLVDDASARAVAPQIWRLFRSEPWQESWPEEFLTLVYAANAIEDIPWWENSLPWFEEAARKFLATRG